LSGSSALFEIKVRKNEGWVLRPVGAQFYDFIGSWFLPQAATCRERRGTQDKETLLEVIIVRKDGD